MDALIYAQVMTPASKNFWGLSVSPKHRMVRGIIFYILIVGWALGGILGVLADYPGRSRTLVITILVYAVFTALAGFSQSLVATRSVSLLTALGVGSGDGLPAPLWWRRSGPNPCA